VSEREKRALLEALDPITITSTHQSKRFISRPGLHIISRRRHRSPRDAGGQTPAGWSLSVGLARALPYPNPTTVRPHHVAAGATRTRSIGRATIWVGGRLAVVTVGGGGVVAGIVDVLLRWNPAASPVSSRPYKSRSPGRGLKIASQKPLPPKGNTTNRRRS